MTPSAKDEWTCPHGTIYVGSSEFTISTRQLANGNWEATVRSADFEHTQSLFHDDDEANDWADMIVRFLTSD